MIRSISFANYRIFADRQNLTLAPVTVIFGKNNVGKSAVLKLPMLIKNILDQSNDNSEIFDKSVNGLRICEDYSDVVYKKGHRAVSFIVSDEETNNVELDFFVESRGAPCTNIEKFHAKLSDGSEVTDYSQRKKIFDFDIEYLKSIRDFPTNGYFSLSEMDGENMAGGMFTYRRLVRDIYNQSGELCSEVSRWYERTFDGWGIEVDTSRQPIYSVLLTHNGLKNNILDGGAGIAQSLPVVISAASAIEAPKLCVYEEPETHLHPEAHGEIAEFIAQKAIASNYKKYFLIESHSVNFLLRLRTLVANGTLSPDDLALYYIEFDQEKNQSYLKKVTVHKDGSVEGWPENVFKETLEESMALRRAQLKREETGNDR